MPDTDRDVRGTLQTMATSWLVTDEMRQHRKYGTERDRQAAASFLGVRYDQQLDASRIFLANGTQNVLVALLAVLAGGGGTVLVEEMTYRQIREVAQLLDLKLISVPLDDDGILPDALEDACKSHRAKVLYCIPTVQNPRASIMPEKRRRCVASIARNYGLAIIEDEAQGLIPVDAPPPFSAIAPEITWTVTGLSKCTLVGLRIAYVVAPSPGTLTRVMAPFESMAFWYASVVSASLMTHFIESGLARRLLTSIQAEAIKRQAMARAVLPETMIRGANGLHVWMADPGMPGDRLAAEAARAGVLVRSGSEYAIESSPLSPGVRISLADVSESDLAEALSRLAVAFRQ
ncbi:PLP-dependent aminotransferase family protein [Bradyrhizobium sp. ISRA443]|uniref:aminotransferase-like domain-containing protein n=1 Tax=unclassified Bradyrhizobium TaxID=2631580 RepID=UPI002479BC3D|nr:MULTISPECIES: PLP-dependent aminotransferase family protein [unclassified Bradyrhizobium]WGR93349.1 PLP-dependent aminotransferase family protein [Bradyrhizobium sp. ISRA435]WGR97882.1 PLP-dependent aminotransferase family protein [Bradyrhizobium sp. ISRA436]WGS04772.1 PLP-dependent aminotransferase family protein [Bradyrhizobium sp. ISRA437]WGS11653.1 PLP-dependent aminotransferase family protein [Bradyrhizobium sp. ISRA443]